MKKHRFLVRLVLCTLMVSWVWGSAMGHADDQRDHDRQRVHGRSSDNRYRQETVRNNRYRQETVRNNRRRQETVRDNRRRPPTVRDNRYKPPTARDNRYRPVVVRGQRHFYRQGYFYRRGARGYFRERAPLGALIVSLPFGFRTFGIGGGIYFEFGGTYYQRAPQGYIVVAPPVGAPPVVYSAPGPVSGSVTVTAALLNIRSGPGMNYGVIDRVQAGITLPVMGRSGSWLYVQLPSGEMGWALESFTVPAPPSPSG